MPRDPYIEMERRYPQLRPFGRPEPRHQIEEFIETVPKKMKPVSEIRMSDGTVWLTEEPAEFLAVNFKTMEPGQFARLLVKDRGGRISWALLRAGFVSSVRPV
jgi:hypothetical protein